MSGDGERGGGEEDEGGEGGGRDGRWLGMGLWCTVTGRFGIGE